MSKYINPFTDFGFKRIFGEEFNKDLLIDFLNELLREEEGPITNITYMTPEQLGITAFERRAVFDIYCENERGEKFIVQISKYGDSKGLRPRKPPLLFSKTSPIWNNTPHVCETGYSKSSSKSQKLPNQRCFSCLTGPQQENAFTPFEMVFQLALKVSRIILYKARIFLENP